MRCSIELWLHFALHSLRAIVHLRSPHRVANKEILARELYSGHVTPGGKLNLSAFKAAPSNDYGISVNRWAMAREQLLIELGLASAERRAKKGSKVSFKGFAHFRAGDLRKLDIEDTEIAATAAITKTNPFHANIALPKDRDDDYYLLVASEILDQIQPITCLLRR